jgi:hypothetical protein
MGLVTAGPSEINATGLDFWMDRVVGECNRARLGFAAEPVHDLRVALRRCRSIGMFLWLLILIRHGGR